MFGPPHRRIKVRTLARRTSNKAGHFTFATTLEVSLVRYTGKHLAWRVLAQVWRRLLQGRRSSACHCVAFTAKVNRKRLLVASDPSEKRLRAMAAEVEQTELELRMNRLEQLMDLVLPAEAVAALEDHGAERICNYVGGAIEDDAATATGEVGAPGDDDNDWHGSRRAS